MRQALQHQADETEVDLGGRVIQGSLKVLD